MTDTTAEIVTLPVSEPAVSVESAETQVTDPATTVEPIVETPEEIEAKKTSGFQKRVNKLNAKIQAEVSEKEYWRNEALKSKQPAAQPQQPQVSDNKPKVEQFNSLEEYTDALTDFKLSQVEKQRQIQELQRTQQSTLQSYNKRVSEFVKTNPDFHDLVEDMSDVKVAPEIHTIALESDVGPAIVLHLAKNPDEITRLNGLSPTRRAAELGKLEDRLSKTTPVAKPAPVVAAPAPVKPVSGGSPVTTTKSVYEMSAKELMAYRNATVGRHGRR